MGGGWGGGEEGGNLLQKACKGMLGYIVLCFQN